MHVVCRYVASFLKVGGGQTHLKYLDKQKKRKNNFSKSSNSYSYSVRGGAVHFLIFTSDFYNVPKKLKGGGTPF